MTKDKPRIIVWDLETLPDLKKAMEYFTGLSQYPGKTMKASINSIICCGWKELGANKTHCINAWDFPDIWKEDVNDDVAVVHAIYEMMQGVDGIVTHNGKRFDLKVLNTRLTHHGMPPLPKIWHFDTCAVARSKLSLINNKLNTVAEHFGCDTKMSTGGWKLWVNTLQRDEESQKKMSQYCKQDVNVLEQVFLKMRALGKDIPNYNQFTDGTVCPACGSPNIHRNGIRRTMTREYPRYRCNNCGASSRGNSKDEDLRMF